MKATYFMTGFPGPVIPYFGEGEPEGNFVPADYVLQAASYLSIHPVGENKTYHLTDPSPYKMWELQKNAHRIFFRENPSREHSDYRCQTPYAACTYPPYVCKKSLLDVC